MLLELQKAKIDSPCQAKAHVNRAWLDGEKTKRSNNGNCNPGNRARNKNVSDGGGDFFALAIAALIKTGPYASNLTPTSDHSLGLKQVLFIRTQFPDLATSKTQADCQTVMEQVRQRYVRFSYGRTDMNVTVRQWPT